MASVLDDGEVVILREDNVTDADGKKISLILTNKRIIKTIYDFWGNGTNYTLALSRLRESNGTPNVRVGKGPNGKNRLELYFEKSQQFFSFKGLLVEQKWLSAITKAYKSRMKEIAKSEREPLDVGKVFAPVLGKIDAAKEAAKDVAKDAFTTREKRVQAQKCPFCGAIIDSPKGAEVKCRYCDTTFFL